VLMDIVLEGEMDEIEAAAHIKSLCEIPIVYLTAYADQKTLERAKITEPYGYILKPFDDRDLHITIDIGLHKHRMERQLRETEERLRKTLEDTIRALASAVELRDPYTAGHQRRVTDLAIAIAKELSHILKRREADEDKAKLLNQLHHADRLATVGELAAGVAHEINEPLGSILGFAQLASKYRDIPDQVKMDIEKIISASLHAREIVKKMMVFSRQVSPEKKEINLNQVVEDSLYFLKSRCIKEGIELQLSLEQGLPAIIADPVQINQVLVNIVVNAMQAMPGGGKLIIRTGLSDIGIKLSIMDTGLGMNENVLQQIFNPFFTTKGVDKGLGLGLSVVDGIIKSHGGKIGVRSKPGKGSEFVIKLPCGK